MPSFDTQSAPSTSPLSWIRSQDRSWLSAFPRRPKKGGQMPPLSAPEEVHPEPLSGSRQQALWETLSEQDPEGQQVLGLVNYLARRGAEIPPLSRLQSLDELKDRVARRSPDLRHEIELRRAWALLQAGEPRRARRLTQALRQDPERSPSQRARAALLEALSRAHLGEVQALRGVSYRDLDAEEASHFRLLLARAQFRLGRWLEAEECLRDLAAHHQGEDPQGQWRAELLVLDLALARGDLDEAHTLFERLEFQALPEPRPQSRAQWQLDLRKLALAISQGDLSRAQELSESLARNQPLGASRQDQESLSTLLLRAWLVDPKADPRDWIQRHGLCQSPPRDVSGPFLERLLALRGRLPQTELLGLLDGCPETLRERDPRAGRLRELLEVELELSAGRRVRARRKLLELDQAPKIDLSNRGLARLWSGLEQATRPSPGQAPSSGGRKVWTRSGAKTLSALAWDKGQDSRARFDLFVDLEGPEVELQGEPSALKRHPARIELLAYFLKHPDRALDKRELIEEVWGRGWIPYETDTLVYKTVARLRSQLPPGWIQTTPEGYRLGRNFDFLLAEAPFDTGADSPMGIED